MPVLKVQPAPRRITDDPNLSEGQVAVRLLEGQGFVLRKATGPEMCGRCPWHEGPGPIKRGESPKLYINSKTGLFHCFAARCSMSGSLRTLQRHFGFDTADPGYVSLRTRVEEWVACFDKSDPVLMRPWRDRGITAETLERFRIGWDAANRRYVIPYRVAGHVTALRYYKPDGPPSQKYRWDAGSEAQLFNVDAAEGVGKRQWLLIMGGEAKAMLLAQSGYHAIGVPGEGMWKAEWFQYLVRAQKLAILFDTDNPRFHRSDPCPRCADVCQGHNPGLDAALKLNKRLGGRAHILKLPLPNPDMRKTDVNEYVVRDGGTIEGLLAQLDGPGRKPDYQGQSFAQRLEAPPEKQPFLVEHGILPTRGRLLVTGPAKAGKAQPLSAPVLTPTGWTTMGALQVGQDVVGADGRPTRVRAIHPQGVKPIYRVAFSDGVEVECTAEHLWNIQTQDDRQAERADGRPRWGTLATQEIADLLARGRTRHTYLPIVGPVQFEPCGPAPFDPYVLGLLLGDGSLVHQPTLTTPDKELHDALAKAVAPFGCELRTETVDHGHTCLTSHVRHPGGPTSPVIDLLRELGLHGHRSWEKFIPPAYLRGSIEDRLALLQGLMDTDGCVELNPLGNTAATFSTSSPQLADDLCDIVRSLGGIARRGLKRAPRHQNGVGRPSHTIRVVLPRQFAPFRLARKRDAWFGRTSKNTRPNRRITAVEYVRDEEAQCITVAAADGLYVTDHYVVTHNSLLVENLGLCLTSSLPFLGRFDVPEPQRVLLLDRELSERALFDRLEMLITARPGYELGAENLIIDHTARVKFDEPDSAEQLVDIVEHYRVGVIMFDTAYKFFTQSFVDGVAVAKAFEALDECIRQTGVSVVLSHHQRKRGVSQQARQRSSIGEPDEIVGTFLWTGWPNATIMLNFTHGQSSPLVNTLTFTAFRDAPPPEPLVLHRSSESVAYTVIEDYVEEVHGRDAGLQQGSADIEDVAALLLQLCPISEPSFLHLGAAKLRIKPERVRAHLLGLLGQGRFIRSGRPAVIEIADQVHEDAYQQGELVDTNVVAFPAGGRQKEGES